MTQIKSTKAKELLDKDAMTVEFNGSPVKYSCHYGAALKAVEIAEAEADERHANELQELKDKAIKAYISTCIKNENGVCCIDDGECPVNCHRVELFTQKLNEQ